MLREKGLLSISVLLSGVLAGCGGGGGGASPNTVTGFTSWSAIQRNTTVVAEGLSQSGTYNYNVGADLVTSRTLGPASVGASYSASYDQNGLATAATIVPAGGSAISWSRAAGDTFGFLIINNNIDAVVSVDGSRYALAANPFGNLWDYQSFGVWVTGAGTGSGTYGSISVGAATAGASIPTSGSATFNGISGGFYVDNLGQQFFTSSSMSAVTNFATRTVAFSTTNTQVTRDLLNVSANANLNMTGNLSYAAATNQISGGVATVGGLTGSVTARFYGPSAQEIGGTFALDAGVGGLQGYAGAFGGRR